MMMISPSTGRCLSVPYLWLTRTWDGNAEDMMTVDVCCRGLDVVSVGHISVAAKRPAGVVENRRRIPLSSNILS